MRAAREELEETVLVELQTTPFDPWPPSGDLRVAFYMHLWDAERPLETSYGPVACPTPTAMPDRLWRLIPYRPVD